MLGSQNMADVNSAQSDLGLWHGFGCQYHTEEEHLQTGTRTAGLVRGPDTMTQEYL